MSAGQAAGTHSAPSESCVGTAPPVESLRFFQAISHSGVLGRKGACDALRERAAHLEELTARDAQAHAKALESGVPRLFIIEAEYVLNGRRAKLGWVERGVHPTFVDSYLRLLPNQSNGFEACAIIIPAVMPRAGIFFENVGDESLDLLIGHSMSKVNNYGCSLISSKTLHRWLVSPSHQIGSNQQRHAAIKCSNAQESAADESEAEPASAPVNE